MGTSSFVLLTYSLYQILTQTMAILLTLLLMRTSKTWVLSAFRQHCYILVAEVSRCILYNMTHPSLYTSHAYSMYCTSKDSLTGLTFTCTYTPTSQTPLKTQHNTNISYMYCCSILYLHTYNTISISIMYIILNVCPYMICIIHSKCCKITSIYDCVQYLFIHVYTAPCTVHNDAHMCTYMYICIIHVHACAGERRIRVHTLCLPVSSQPSVLYSKLNVRAIVGVLANMGKIIETSTKNCVCVCGLAK